MLTWNCSRCKKRFYVESDYLNHRDKYGDKCPKIKCQDCKKVFRKELELRKHAVVCPVNFVECSICKQEIHRSNFRYHRPKCGIGISDKLFNRKKIKT